MTEEGQNHERFLRTFLQHENDLRSYARALVPGREAVNEVMQEASVVMWRKLDQLRDESEFLPWAKVIVRYEALKARQSVARDQLSFGEDVYELLAADDGATGDDALDREREALDHCLDKLGSPQRKLVLLPYHGRGAVTDLATETGQTVNSLYKKIGRLRSKLTQCVELNLNNPNLEGGNL